MSSLEAASTAGEVAACTKRAAGECFLLRANVGLGYGPIYFKNSSVVAGVAKLQAHVSWLPISGDSGYLLLERAVACDAFDGVKHFVV